MENEFKKFIVVAIPAICLIWIGIYHAIKVDKRVNVKFERLLQRRRVLFEKTSTEEGELFKFVVETREQLYKEESLSFKLKKFLNNGPN